MARTKKTVVSGISREQAEQAFADFAAADAKVQNLTSKMDLEMTRIREKYADQLAELSATKEKNFDIMQAYAVENKEELFSRKKSLESAHGVFFQGVTICRRRVTSAVCVPPPVHFTGRNSMNTAGASKGSSCSRNEICSFHRSNVLMTGFPSRSVSCFSRSMRLR